jgi:DHA2 family multidrug resistance protein
MTGVLKGSKTQAMASKSSPKPAEEAYDHHVNKWLVAIAVIFGVLMSTIDSSVVNVALPNIQGNLGATQQEVTWISTGYMISVVILMPLTNWLSRRFGRKNIYITSLIIFTLSSMACGSARTLPELVAWRIVQGMGAGCLQPIAQSIILEAFPPAERGMANGLFGFVVLFGPAIGPTLGGYITDNISWPWIFYVNLPIGIAGVLFASRYLWDPPYMRGDTSMKVDGVGIGLLALGLASFQTVLEQGQTEDWFNSGMIVFGTVVTVVALCAFVWWELHSDNPAVDLRVLKDPTYAAGTFVGAVIMAGLFSSIFLLPQYMQTLLGLTATQSGIAMMPRSLVMIVAMPLLGVFYNKIGPKFLLFAGMILAVVSVFAMTTFTLQSSTTDVILPQLFQGLAFAMTFISLTTVTLMHVPRTKMTSASGLNNLVRQLGGSFGMTIFVTILTRHIDKARSALIPNFTVTSHAFAQRLGAYTGFFHLHGYSFSAARTAGLLAINGIATRQAVMLSYEYVFACISVLFVICIPLLFFLNANSPVEVKPSMAVAE